MGGDALSAALLKAESGPRPGFSIAYIIIAVNKKREDQSIYVVILPLMIWRLYSFTITSVSNVSPL